MENVKGYTVISAKTLIELITGVNQAINDGWQPIGGVSSYVIRKEKTIKNNDPEVIFLQAMGM